MPKFQFMINFEEIGVIEGYDAGTIWILKLKFSGEWNESKGDNENSSIDFFIKSSE